MESQNAPSVPIDELSDLAAQAGISRSSLVSALYVLRAPRSLHRIAECAQHFAELREKFPELGSCRQIENFDSRLQVLDWIANTQAGHPVFGAAKRSRTPKRALQPLCGDSVICDALLTRHRQKDEVADDQFEILLGWFTWQAIRFQARCLQEVAYEHYLSNQGRLLEEEKGSVIYGAWLILRKFAIGARTHELGKLVALLPELSEEPSRRLAILARLATLKRPSLIDGLRSMARRRYALDDQEIDRRITSVTDLIAEPIALFLSDTWNIEGREQSDSSSRLNRRFSGRTVIDPELAHFGQLAEVLTPVEIDGVRTGLVVDYYVSVAGEKPERLSDTEDDDDDRGEDTHADPAISLFLADKTTQLEGVYAARGLQTAIEYQNANLPWSRWRLSQEAIMFVAAMIAFREGESAHQSRIKLTIGLSLIAGRSLEDCAGVRIRNHVSEFDPDDTIGITAGDHCLMVLAGTPNLKSEKLKVQCLDPHRQRLFLPLPESWRPLVIACGVGFAPNPPEVARAANKKLKACPPFLGISVMGIRKALSVELHRQFRGDGGLVKTITDTTDLNLQNIIHYSSYLVEVADREWHQAAEKLVGPLPPPFPQKRVARVGAPHGFNIGKLCAHMQVVRTGFDKHCQDEDWARAYTYLTLHTVYWLLLATVGRKSKSPVPRIVIESGWAYVSDKARPDGSTDRLIPLSPAFLAQFDAWLSFAEHLGLAHPSLTPIEGSEVGLGIVLRFANKDGVTLEFHPKTIERGLRVGCLPGNWARKVVRAEGVRLGLSGRAIDAVCGHVARGRRPFRMTSTLPTGEFRRQWLESVAKLESELDLQVLSVPGFVAPRRRLAAQLPASGTAPAQIPTESTSATQLAEVDALMRSVDRELYDDLFESGPSAPPQAALELVRRTLQSLKNSDAEQVARVAEIACERIRTGLNISLYAVRPRPQFQKDWLVNADELQTLGWCQEHFLPRFVSDLECLPTAMKGDVGDRIEFGRLVMLAVWRLGLVRRPNLDAFLSWLATPQPILATGDLRYVVLKIPSRRSGEWMNRTLFFDEFCSTFLLYERERLRRILTENYFSRDEIGKRSKLIGSAMTHYLRSIGVTEAGPTLAKMMGACVQSIMLDSSPILAAYARGEFVTHDLGDAELRRMAGLVPVRESAVKALGAQARSKAAPDPDELLADTAASTDDAVDRHVPKDIQRNDVVHQLVSHASDVVADLRAKILATPVSTASETLIKHFVLWMLDDVSKDAGSLKKKAKSRWRNYALVVGHSLMGLLALDEKERTLDAETLDRLEELGEQFFPERTAHGAWTQFRRFACDRTAKDALQAKEGQELHAGFTFPNVSDAYRNEVSARMLRADQIETIRSQLGSLLSGLSNPVLLHAASLHFSLSYEIAGRRSEMAGLRSEDAQGDLLRVQAYEDHRLKSGWSKRNVPIEVLSKELRNLIEHAKTTGLRRLIDLGPDQSPGNDHFFYAINRTIKEVTGDDSLGLHHLRHTTASRLLLSVLVPACRLETVSAMFPWIEPLLADKEQLEALLGGEDEMGQGLQAISALLGHSHPTTSLRHYIHTLAIALFAALRSFQPVSLLRTFENRMKFSTAQRWATNCRSAGSGMDDGVAQKLAINRAFRDLLEAKPQYRDQVDRDERKAPAYVPMAARLASNEAATRLFRRLEELDRMIRRAESASSDPWLSQSREGLARLAAFPSGKRGSKLGRHPLEILESGGGVPPRIKAGTATAVATAVIDWLEMLRTERPDSYGWLISKWILTVDRDEGLMRLIPDDDKTYVDAMPSTGAISLKTWMKPEQRSEAGKKRGIARAAAQDRKASAVTYAYIDCPALTDGAHDTSAVRWVMSWCCAIELGKGEAWVPEPPVR